MDENSGTFVIHVAFFNLPLASKIYPDKAAQIVSLLIEEVKILEEYSDFTEAFSEEKALILPERTEFNQQAIELKEGKQPPYKPIYSLGLVELEILKNYIKTHLNTGFIRPSKSSTSAPITFDKKPDGSFFLCVNNSDLNNLTIKNWYLLFFISELLDYLGQAKRFTQLDLTSTYHRMRIKKSDEWKTTFQTRYSYFKYQVMLFGLSNAPTSF